MVQPQTEAAASCGNSFCDKSSSDDLLNCSACKKVRYCSKACQKQDWKHHKLFCKHVTTDGASSVSLDPLDYYENIAVHEPGVQALARDIGITLPTSRHKTHGIQLPIRRLVAVGKDDPKNLALFFGQTDIAETHKEVRLEILLRPPPGSPMYAMAKRMKLDDNCPPWTPREPSAAEAREVKETRDMQDTIRRHMGSRGVEDVSTSDMRDILVANFGNRWPQGMKVYQNALNSMDRGVGV